MRHKSFIWSFVVLFVVGTVTLLYAQNVLDADMRSPVQVVKARKYLMQTISANLKELARKFQAGNIQDIPVNADSIAAIATVIPPLFKEKYEQVYPIPGSKTFFKGASASEFKAASESLRISAIKIKQSAANGNKKGIEDGLAALTSSCGMCHSAYRGKQ